MLVRKLSYLAYSMHLIRASVVYGISLVTSIFPLGLIIYHFKRCFEKDDSEAHVDNAANSPGVV